MSIFGKIMGAIFGTKAEAAPAGGGTATSTGSSSGSAAPAQTVDVAAIVDKAAAAKGEKLEWRTSIVDLMKLLKLDSSLGARKQLAQELFPASARLSRPRKGTEDTVARVQQEMSQSTVVNATKERATAMRQRAQQAAMSQLQVATREDVARLQASLDRVEAALNDLAKRLPESKPRPRPRAPKPATPSEATSRTPYPSCGVQTPPPLAVSVTAPRPPALIP